MKIKKMTILTILIMAAVLPAAGVSETFGGDMDWPTFHGMQLGLSMPYVLLYEEYTNGNSPMLIRPAGKTLEEVSEENQTYQLWYSIGREELYGVDCEIIYLFEDNVFLSASVKGNAASKETAKTWTENMQALFNARYGDIAHGDISLNAVWQKRSSQLEYNIPMEWEGHMRNCLTREYIWPVAAMRSIEMFDNETYEVSASVSMRYICNDYDNVMFAFNGTWDGEEIFTNDGKQSGQGLTEQQVREKLGDAASDILDAKYHDSRYYH